jgi:hypothetical protein
MAVDESCRPDFVIPIDCGIPLEMVSIDDEYKFRPPGDSAGRSD